MSSFNFDVFISYSHNDADWVKSWLLPRLEASGLRVCVDFRDFEIGAPSIVNMENAVQRSRKTLLVLTPKWVQSEWASFESLLIQTRDPIGTRRRLLPLMLEKCDLPDRLGIFTHSNFTDVANWDSELVRLVNSIQPTVNLIDVQPIRPNLVHPYPLQANFTGRLKEREELTAWLKNSEKPIYELIAMGGMGKSALTWYWVTRDVLPSSDTKLDGLMWWSFYEGESSFAGFIDDALKYVTRQPVDADQFPTTYDRALELRRVLQDKPVLFVLDGFERQLRAYASLDAGYRIETASIPSRESRSCVDPNGARLLTDIGAFTTRAKVVITTRLSVSDLQDRAGEALAGVESRELKELQPDDAAVFMQAQGVTKGTVGQIKIECAHYGYHPLSLRLLSGLIKHDAKAPGDISAAPRHDVNDSLIQRQHHVLEQSYNALRKSERALISRIAAFRGPMNYGALSIFNTLRNEERFQEALEDLRLRGLLQRDLEHSRYDLHPIVRNYCYTRLTDKTGVHTKLHDYFAKVSPPEDDDVQAIEDLSTVIELYHHTVGAKRYEEALQLFRHRLYRSLNFNFGAYQTQIELLRVLFPDGEDNPPRLTKESDQSWTLDSLGGCYAFTGQPRLAIPLAQAAANLDIRRGSRIGLAVELGNIASQNILLGELTTAEEKMKQSIEMLSELREDFHEAVPHCRLGELLSYTGQLETAEEELNTALELFTKHNARQSIGVVWSIRAWRALLMGSIGSARRAAQKAHKLAITVQNERDRIRAEWLLGVAMTREASELAGASTHLAEALTRCRRISLVEIEPDILLALANWHRTAGNAREAHTYGEEALAIADRSEYRLKQAEIHNFMARLAFEADDRAKALRHAEIAKERAWCDGPLHCYKTALDEAEAMLKESSAKK